jgi:hypothetical protein
MTDIAARMLGEAIPDDGIRWLNAFNGRILSAEDLRVDQDAIARARQQLGRAVGAGVVLGLGVDVDPSGTADRPILGVDLGLAINRAGQPIELRQRITIGLVAPDAAPPALDDDFVPCDVVLTGTTGLGAYVLSIGPARVDAGKAAVAGLGNDPASCNTAYSVEAVRFQLFPIDLDPAELDDDRKAKLRNHLAYRMYGEPDPRSALDRVEPYAARERLRNGLDDLQETCLKDTDVALAIVMWRPREGVSFVDPWSVRRRATSPTPGTSFVVPDRDAALAEGEARYLQLLDQLRDALAEADDPGQTRATGLFDYLPPAGVIPIATPVTRGFDRDTFFTDVIVRGPAYIESALVPDLLRESLAFPPIDLSRKRVIWTYLIRENAQTPRRRPFPGLPGIHGIPGTEGSTDWRRAAAIRLADRGPVLGTVPYGSAVQAPSCLLFTTGDMRYRGDARFNLGYWNFANFADID